MKHFGDITKIRGFDVPMVNVIIGGSPCQDLSVAGERNGLQGTRSNLFMEQIRIIEEMRKRDADNGTDKWNIHPRYMVWENVPGAFSTNNGEDFRTILQSTARVVDKTAVIPRPPKKRWRTSGCIMGDRWSIAWRVFDAQFWGVPQRRRRIALIADFGGHSAPEILFEREGLRRHATQGKTNWDGLSGKTDEGACTSTNVIGYGFPIGFLSKSTLLYEEAATTICSGTRPGYCNGILLENVINGDCSVRRVTPLECERLQGFPDGWTDIGDWVDSNGKVHKNSDNLRYKALANSIAIPPWSYVLQRILPFCGSDRTMASLFDGIGGFPLIWETFNGHGSCLWASEIDEFAMAVTKLHFCKTERYHE